MDGEQGTAKNPIYMAFVPQDPNVRMLVKSVIWTVVPIGVALLMQRPELRQRLIMRGSRTVSDSCFTMGEFFHGLALRAGTVYQKARM